MPNISGHVYYDQTNLLTPGIGIANVPVALFDPAGLLSATALTDANGAFGFTNVPNGSYQVIEAWGAAGGIATPVNYTASAVPTAIAPTEKEPPLSALSVVPPAMADMLNALTPNLLNIIVSGSDITNLVFFDGPVGDKPLVLTGINMVGPNLITVADNGTFGSYPAGTPGTTIPPVAPYPGVTPGFIYSTIQAPPDGFYTIFNTTTGYATSPYWISSDHTTGLETGRFQFVNGDNPGSAMFEQVVNVTPNTNYVLSAWVMNLINRQTGFADPSLGIQVRDQNGNVIISQSVNPIPAQQLAVWFQNGFLFNSGTNSTLTVQVISLGPAARGNDYVIDDVAMYEAQFVDLLTQTKTITPSTVYSQTGVGDSVTISVNIQNPSTQTINNVFFQDVLDSHLQFVPGSVTVNGSGIGFATADPNVGFSLGNMATGSVNLVQFQATTTSGPASVANTAQVSYDAITSGTGDIIRATFPSNTANVDIVVNNAVVAITKAVNKAYANVGDVLTYTLTLNNTGNVPANNVNLTDAIPAGTTYVAGSLTGASGTFPNLTLNASIAAGGSAIVTFQVLVENAIPSPNPIPNNATAAYTFTIDPTNPNGASSTATSNTVNTEVNSAIVTTLKEADLAFAAPGDIITYTITLTNSGNTSADNVVLTDIIPAGTTFVAGSLSGATGTLPTLTLLAPIPAGGNATVSFQVQVGATIPNPNPLLNSATAAFTYTVDPSNPDGVSGSSTSNTTSTKVNGAIVSTVKSVDKAFGEPGDVLTYTLVLTNTGNTSADNVVITDSIPTGTTYVAGSVTGATGVPPTLNLTNPIPVNGSVTVTYQVLVGNSFPVPNPISNTASTVFTFTIDPAEPDARTGDSTSNTVTTQINSAIVTIEKTATPAFSDVGGTVKYTITLTNSGNVAATNVVLTDTIPTGTTFVAGSLVGATGTPPTLILANSIPAGGSSTITFDVLVGNSVPNPNPIENSVSAVFKYTVDPAQPNGVSGSATGGPAGTQVNTAKLVLTKGSDKSISYIGDIIAYQISVKNTGNVAADNVVLTDLLATGTSYVAGSLVVSVPYSGTLASGLSLTGAIPAGGTVTLSFKIKVNMIPNPNPILNKMTATYAYTVDPAAPDAISATASSNIVSTIVFRYNFSQQISDLIESVALEQAALAAIAQAEGAKIQKMVVMDDVTTQELLCLNKSVSEMMDSLAMLEAVLKQKLNIANCQIDGSGAGCM
ncbi:DUF7507 domain-containing protein [Amedibacillus sp. YH-ame6]